MKRYPRELVDVFRGWKPTGSRYYGVAQDGADHDWLCLGTRHEAAKLRADEADSCNNVPYFTSLRFGTVNVIVAHDDEFYNKFLTASEVCRLVQPTVKSHRIAIFRAILYGETPE